MKFIFKNIFIHNNEILFYVFLIIMLLMIIFATYVTYKEVKNESK